MVYLVLIFRLFNHKRTILTKFSDDLIGFSIVLMVNFSFSRLKQVSNLTLKIGEKKVSLAICQAHFFIHTF
ncbi:MAG: hypothetical protein CTY10_06525 [Methylotenera sp.]|nr:MAG: hypothetical protein CTY10_06525 [Methylotenera sp.]